MPSNPLSLSPGRHRVKLKAKGKSFDYSVSIKTGKMSKLVKRLAVGQ